MGCLKLTYQTTKPQLKVVHRNRSREEKCVQWFLSLDPKADATDLVSSSPYSFALNNPITFQDPEGDCPPGVDCVGIAIRVKLGWDRLKSSFSKKVDNANRVASGMVTTYDKADKTTGVEYAS